jgi:hypothetical protein
MDGFDGEHKRGLSSPDLQEQPKPGKGNLQR